MAMNEKKLIFLVLVATFHVTYTKGASLSGQDSFPKDLPWLAPPNKENTEQENDTNVDTNNYKVCQTKDCIKIAEEFLGRLNKSVDPCDDFYEFTCGGWTEDKIPPRSTSWSGTMMFRETAERRIKGILESKLELTDILPVRQAKKWYRSCMDTEGLERRGIKPIESILMQVGGWPISMDDEEWDPKAYTWQIVDSHYVFLTGRHAFYKFVMARTQIEISPLSIPLEDQLPEKSRNYTGDNYETYVRFIERVANMFVQLNRANVSKERVRQEAEKIVDFENEMYKLKDNPYYLRQSNSENLTEKIEACAMEIDDDPKLKFNWKSVIQGILKGVNIEIDPYTKVVTTDTLYFKGLCSILKKTPSRTIVNYIHWNFVSAMLKYTTEAMRDEIFEIVRGEYGAKSRPPRWSECVNDIKMSHVAPYIFVNNYFTESTKNAARKMIKNIELAIESQINNSNWLDESSKTIVKDKLNSMGIFLGFPEWYKNKTAVINYYKGLTIGTEYFDNALSYMRYAWKKNLKRLVDPEKEKDPWDFMDPITVNSYYDSDANSIIVPAVHFQAPLFTKSLPESVNYGITGFLVGHEMGHGFDSKCIEFSKYGNKTILSQKTIMNYYQRAECFLDQFDVYYNVTRAELSKPVYEPENKASQTRGENIADTLGFQAAFEAFRNQNTEGSLRLPGLEEFTDEQLLFISYAASRCEVSTPEHKIKKDFEDRHSPAHLRVIGPVTNTKDFGKVFNCPEGKAMNPTKKCSIW